MGSQLIRIHLEEVRPYLVHEGDTYRHLRHDPLDRRLARLLVQGQRLGEQIPQQVHLDAPFSQMIHEDIMLLPGFADPENVVEEELLGVRRGESLKAQVRTVDQHLAESAYL